MNPEYLKTVIERQFSEWMKVSRHRMGTGEEVCRVILPLWEPSGDVVTVYITERDGQTIVDDGGHISGLLFGSRPKGPTKKDRDLVERLLLDSGLTRNADTGVVSVETTENGLRYWLIELGRVIALVPALIPITHPNSTRTGPSRVRGRTALQVRNRLVHAGFSKVIRPPQKVRGVSERTHTVDLSYATHHSPIGLGGSDLVKTVHVMAVDLDVANPFEKADKSIAVVNDLLWSTNEADLIDVRMVYGFGSEGGVEEPAAKLLAAAGERSAFNSYSWDDKEAQNRFLTHVGQDLVAQVA